MERRILLTVTALLLMAAAFAQPEGTDQVKKKALVQLGFLVGDWQGEGWIIGKDGTQRTFSQTETIRFKLDSTAILIEGRGMQEGRIIHDALAIVSFNKEDNGYVFHSYLANGKEGKFKGELKDGRFHWYPNERMRYIIHLNEKGQWQEIGETRNGEEWFRFFEMTLDKQ